MSGDSGSRLAATFRQVRRLPVDVALSRDSSGRLAAVEHSVKAEGGFLSQLVSESLVLDLTGAQDGLERRSGGRN